MEAQKNRKNKQGKVVTADGFSVKSQMKNAKVLPPPSAGAFDERELQARGTDFRKFYERGDFPIALEHDTKGNKIAWKVSISSSSFMIMFWIGKYPLVIVELEHTCTINP